LEFEEIEVISRPCFIFGSDGQAGVHSGAVCFNYFAQDLAVNEFESRNEPIKGLP
jgi:hypothetical protein